jgi:outer membrane receptor protein involved in Fe transport
VFNVPLVEDVFAIRLAAQSAEDGGYIDNVPGHMPDTWWGETAAENAANYGVWYWGHSRQEWGKYRNDDVVEKNWNSAKFTALRLSAKWEINDNWSATAAYHYGETDSQGSAGYNPYVGDLETIGFVKNTSHSEWDMQTLTIEANYDFFQFVSATSVFDNQRTYVIDNTLYYKYYTTAYGGDHGEWADNSYYWHWNNTSTGRAVYAPLYVVTPVGGDPVGGPTQIPDMAGVGEGPEWQERFTQEFRLSHQGETFDWLAGLYYEDSNDSWNSVWMKDANTPFEQSMSYAFMKDCASGDNPNTSAMWQCNAGSTWGQLGTYGGADAINAALVDADHYWDSRDDTDWKTKAVFGEITWHATDQLDVTVGGRWFETENDKLYIKWLAGHTNRNGRHVGGYIQQRWIGNDITQSATIREFVPKFSVAYTFDEDKMMYGSYTVGYRTGGINRANKNADWSRTLWGQVWDPDELKNYELGYKSRFADNKAQLNLTYFYMDWEDFQHEVVDPSSGDCVIPAEEPFCDSGKLPWLSIVGNVGDAHSTGITAELDWVPADGWHIGANLQWISAEIDSTSADERSGIEKGQELPNVPDLQGAFWVTKTWPVNVVPGGEMFIRGQFSYSGETHTRLDLAGEDTPLPNFYNDSYMLGDLRLGLTSPDGGWQVDLFVNNVTDERAQIYQGSALGAWTWGRTGEYEHGHDVYTVRPREYGIRFSAQWGD